jgi:hypothetical protein
MILQATGVIGVHEACTLSPHNQAFAPLQKGDVVVWLIHPCMYIAEADRYPEQVLDRDGRLLDSFRLFQVETFFQTEGWERSTSVRR